MLSLGQVWSLITFHKGRNKNFAKPPPWRNRCLFLVSLVKNRWALAEMGLMCVFASPWASGQPKPWPSRPLRFEAEESPSPFHRGKAHFMAGDVILVLAPVGRLPRNFQRGGVGFDGLAEEMGEVLVSGNSGGGGGGWGFLNFPLLAESRLWQGINLV